MYKCNNCGNIDKFIGFVKESGHIFITRNHLPSEIDFEYDWVYRVSEGSWKSSIKVVQCFYCNSRSIKKN